jgi:predicted phosphohydrolase
MNLQYASDLHLEFPENNQLLSTHPLQPAVDILILAGDIVPFSALNKVSDFFTYVSDHFQTTYWIPGNHEYYGSDIANTPNILEETIKPNVFLVNNVVKHHAGVALVFSTMWTHISPAASWQIERGMSDFRLIKYNGHRFSTDRYNELHQDSMRFLETALAANQSGKVVVATHHVPTFMNYPEIYRGSILNEGFAVEQFDFIQIHQPACWLYGHHHANIPPFQIGQTNIRTNQLGYVQKNEHGLFNPACMVEL